MGPLFWGRDFFDMMKGFFALYDGMSSVKWTTFRTAHIDLGKSFQGSLT